MSNPHRGEVDIKLGERTVTLRPSFEAMVAIETDTGETMSAVARRVVDRDIGTKHIVAIIRQGAKAAGEKVTDAEIKAAVGSRFLDLLPPIANFVINAVNGGATTQDTEKNAPAPVDQQLAS